jgi:DNA-binding transcriptional LysR family regulator
MLDLYKLQIFSVVVQEGSFSAAAERLYITQSAVSQHMKELETALGRQLFERGRRGVTLTPHGEILYGCAQEIFALVTKTENALTDVTQLATGRISIGATPGIAAYLAPDWVQAFRGQYPRLSVTVNSGITAQIIRDVLARRIDLGFIEGELDNPQPPHLGWLALDEIEQKVIVGALHAWWGRDSVQLPELNGQSFIMRPPNSQSRIWLDRVLRQRGITPEVSAEFDNIESIKRTVASGSSLTVLPDYVTANDVKQGALCALSVEGSPLKRVLKLVWDREYHFPPITRAFLTVLTRSYPTLVSMAEFSA